MRPACAAGPAAYTITPALTIDGQIGKIDYRNSDNDSSQVMVRGIYELSRRSAVYLAAGHIDNDGAAAVTLTASPRWASAGRRPA